MAQIEIITIGFKCERCGYEWIPRVCGQRSLVCPKCKSPYWDTPRKQKKKEEVSNK